MAGVESKPDENPQKTGEALPEKKPDEIIVQLRKALENDEGNDKLEKVGDLLYETFKDPKYSPESVLSSVKEVFEENKNDFDPKVTFHEFIAAFGPGLVKLCQLKLLAEGHSLGDFGENKDGVDGKLGKKTKNALKLFFGKKDSDVLPVRVEAPAVPKPAEPAPKPAEPVAKNPEPEILPVGIEPKIPEIKAPKPVPKKEKPAPVKAKMSYDEKPQIPSEEGPKATFTPKQSLAPDIREIYNQHPAEFFNGSGTRQKENMADYFGKTFEDVKDFISDIDPVTNEPFTFLNKPIHGGINLMMMPFLKIAEEEINNSPFKYDLKENQILGFSYRDMIVGGKPSGYPSFHKFGLAIDMDHDTNWPKNGRGDIPDHVVMAMVKAGFNWGKVENADAPYLSIDPMHFQLGFPADSETGLAIINASPTGRKYYEAIKPLLEKARRHEHAKT